MRKLFIKNTLPRTNYTQLHQLGDLRERCLDLGKIDYIWSNLSKIEANFGQNCLDLGKIS